MVTVIDGCLLHNQDPSTALIVRHSDNRTRAPQGYHNIPTTKLPGCRETGGSDNSCVQNVVMQRGDTSIASLKGINENFITRRNLQNWSSEVTFGSEWQLTLKPRPRPSPAARTDWLPSRNPFCLCVYLTFRKSSLGRSSRRANWVVRKEIN